MPHAVESPGHETSIGGKYLAFVLADEEYAIAIRKVQEIIGLRAIMRVPRMQAFGRRMINLRGTMVPVVDLRERFGLPPIDTTSASDTQQAARVEALRCVVIVEVAPTANTRHDAKAMTSMGIVVDRVSEVAVIDATQIEEPPTFDATVRADFLLGKTAGGQRVRLLLDIDRVLAPCEVDTVGCVAA